MHLHFFITTTSIHYKPSWTHKLEENTERLANLGSDYSMVLSATLEFANAGHYSETTLELSRKLSAIKNSPSTSTGLKSLVYLAANPPHTQAHEAEGNPQEKSSIFMSRYIRSITSTQTRSLSIAHKSKSYNFSITITLKRWKSRR